MIITFHKDFTRRYKILPQKIKDKFEERLILFEKDKFNPILNNHSIIGKYFGCRSINVTGDLRAIYRTEGKRIIFVTINSHSNLYR